MPLKSQKTIENLSFQSILSNLKKQNVKFIPIQMPQIGGEIKCVCHLKRKIATIDFDLYPTDSNLSPALQERLSSKHISYLQSNFTSLNKIHSNFGKTSIRFDVKEEDAEEWFQLMISTFSNKSNLTKESSDFPL